MGNPKWEYHVVSLNELFDDGPLQSWLDEKGEEGWELVNVTESTWHDHFPSDFMVEPFLRVTYYFKRLK